MYSLAPLGRGSGRVILAGGGTRVFMMTGDDFRELGVEYSSGQDLTRLIRWRRVHSFLCMRPFAVQAEMRAGCGSSEPSSMG
jgi:hypothetical protein